MLFRSEKVYGRCRFIGEWDDWAMNVHEADAQIERQGRAMRYPFTFQVDKDAQTAWFSSVASCSDLPYYQTSLKYCTCYDFQNRKLPCKHIYRLAAELKFIEIIKRYKHVSRQFDHQTIKNIKELTDRDAHTEQIKRQKSAMNEKSAPSSVNYEARSGIFVGSGKKPYETTENTCTCRDYFTRRLPCKHIYRLRYELQFEPLLELARISRGEGEDTE